MKFSKKSRYGIRALIDLSVNSKAEHVSLNSIAERNRISMQYLEQVFAALRRAGIVKSVKGPQGGYYLGRDASRITVADILSALEGDYQIEEEEVTESSNYAGASRAIQSLIIAPINESVEAILKKVTLEALENEFVSYNETSMDMYYI